MIARSIFNVIDPESGWKADFVVRKARAFSEAEFARREAVTLLGIPLSIASLEDLVVAKLEWAAMGASARQLEDVRSLLRINADIVDRAYIERWVEALGLQPGWKWCAAPLRTQLVDALKRFPDLPLRLRHSPPLLRFPNHHRSSVA